MNIRSLSILLYFIGVIIIATTINYYAISINLGTAIAYAFIEVCASIIIVGILSFFIAWTIQQEDQTF